MSDPAVIKARYKEMIDVCSNQGQLERIAEFYADDFVDHEGPVRSSDAELDGEDERPPGWEKFTRFLQVMRAAFPDRHVEVEFMTVEGDLLTARQTVTGTHLGTFMGVDGSGRRFQISAIDIYRIKEGKIAERWGNADTVGMLQQLALFPAAAENGQPAQEAVA